MSKPDGKARFPLAFDPPVQRRTQQFRDAPLTMTGRRCSSLDRHGRRRFVEAGAYLAMITVIAVHHRDHSGPLWPLETLDVLARDRRSVDVCATRQGVLARSDCCIRVRGKRRRSWSSDAGPARPASRQLDHAASRTGAIGRTWGSPERGNCWTRRSAGNPAALDAIDSARRERKPRGWTGIWRVHRKKLTRLEQRQRHSDPWAVAS